MELIKVFEIIAIFIAIPFAAWALKRINSHDSDVSILKMSQQNLKEKVKEHHDNIDMIRNRLAVLDKIESEIIHINRTYENLEEHITKINDLILAMRSSH